MALYGLCLCLFFSGGASGGLASFSQPAGLASRVMVYARSSYIWSAQFWACGIGIGDVTYALFQIPRVVYATYLARVTARRDNIA